MTLTANNKKILKIAFGLILVFGLLFVFDIVPAEAAFKEVDGVTNSKGTETAVYKDLNRIVNIVMAVGGFIVLVCLIYAGIRLSTAQGNPQARTQGFIGLGMAAVGGWIVVQSRTIAGWIGGFAATS